ncbi:hypothetical protein J2T05_005701, partial [Cupriavidus necator]|nr:hypothetical protein [Cupriavidus necator]
MHRPSPQPSPASGKGSTQSEIGKPGAIMPLPVCSPLPLAGEGLGVRAGGGNSDSLHFVDTPDLATTLSRTRERSTQCGKREARGIAAAAGLLPLPLAGERGRGRGQAAAIATAFTSPILPPSPQPCPARGRGVRNAGSGRLAALLPLPVCSPLPLAGERGRGRGQAAAIATALAKPDPDLTRLLSRNELTPKSWRQFLGVFTWRSTPSSSSCRS